MLSLVLTLIEGARIYAIRMQAECVVQTAMDSCLAEYNRTLQDRYDLFFVDASYGSGSPSETAVRDHMQGYMERNFDQTRIASALGARDLLALSVSSCELMDTRFAMDDQGKAIREQVNAYMTAGPEAALVSGFLDLFDTCEDLDEDSWQQAFDESSSAFEEALHEAEEEQEESEGEETLEEEDGDDEEDSEGSEDLDLVTGMLEEIRDYIGNAFLVQVLGSGYSVSDSSAEGEDLLEDRDLHEGTGYVAGNSHDYDEAGSLIMGQYILEKCGNYREQVDGSALQYEVEYILFGERTDKRNLEEMTERLVLLRAAADLIAIHSVGSCTTIAEAVAIALNIFLGIPEPVTKELILAIWSYAEAIQDVRTLYNGGSVPLIKSGSNWKTSFESLLSFGDGDADSGGIGLDYAMYLRIFLLAEDLMHPEVVTQRLADIMELDVTKAQNGVALYMDWCLDAMQADVTVSSGFGYSVRVRHEITYN